MGALDPSTRFKRVIDNDDEDVIFLHVWAKKNGSGKTRLAIDADPSVYLFGFDKGEDVAVRQSPNRDHVYSAHYHIKRQRPTLEDHQNILAQFEADWEYVLDEKPNNVRTVVVDTATQLKQIAEVAILGEKAKGRKNGKPLGFDYAEVNNWWMNTLQMLHGKGLNAVFISKGREIWDESGRPSGEWEAKAHEAILDFVHISGELVWKAKPLKDPPVFERSFVFEKNRFNPEMVGLSVPSSMCSFTALRNMFLGQKTVDAPALENTSFAKVSP